LGAQGFLHPVELTDLPHEPRRRPTFAQGFMQAPPRVRPATNQDQLVAPLARQGFIDPITISLEFPAKTF